MPPPRQDPARITLVVLCLGGLLACCFWILGPFLPSTIWAVTLVISTWPILLRVQALLGGRRGLAVLAMTVLLLAIVVVPFGSAVSTIVKNSGKIQQMVTAVAICWILPEFFTMVLTAEPNGTTTMASSSTVMASTASPRLPPSSACTRSRIGQVEITKVTAQIVDGRNG